MQKMAPNARFKNLLSHLAGFKQQKSLGTTFCDPRVTDKSEHTISVLMFPDACRTAEKGQLPYIDGLPVDKMECRSVFHTFSWSSHSAKQSVWSIGADEILAAGETIDEDKITSAKDVAGTQNYCSTLHRS